MLSVLYFWWTSVKLVYPWRVCFDELFGAIFEERGEVSWSDVEIFKNLLSFIAASDIRLYKNLFFFGLFLHSALETVELSS